MWRRLQLQWGVVCQDGCCNGVVVVVVVGVPLTESYKLEEDQDWLEGERVVV